MRRLAPALLAPALLAPVLAGWALAGCAAPPSPQAGRCEGLPGGTEMIADLYFGRTVRGAPVSEAAWRDFLAGVVTPRFPDGLTVLHAEGQWRERSSNRIIREPSSVVRIVAPRQPETVRRLEEIRADYLARFAQESVGLVVTEGCVSF